MGRLQDPVNTLALELAASTDAGHRRQAFLTQAAQFGVSCFTYASTGQPGSAIHLETTYPEEWIRHYMEHGYDRVDVVPLESRRSPLPFHWRSALVRPDYGAEAQRVFDEAAAFAIHDGFAVPIHAAGRLSLMSMAVEDASLFQANAAARRNALHLMALHYHLASERALFEPPPAIQLSPREREVLLWAAQGKTGWEIAQILRLTERTVTYHVENARAKLGASSRSHAVAKALSLGLIAP
jgi:DNA-binding CsgD family transcriptional regulator